MSQEDVLALMSQAGELPYGEARTILVEDALRRAEATGDDVLAFRVRVALTNAYHYGGEPVKGFATFSRTLAEHDRDPGRYDSEHNLLWQMKAVVNALTLFPEIPLDRTYGVLDDMERRYLAGGHSLQAVYHYRNAVARHVGDKAAADEWYLKWRAAPRDDLSDCEGCDPTGMVYHLIFTGRYGEAFDIAAPVLNAELSCNEQPQGIMTGMLVPYLRTGRAEQAGEAHRRAYRLHRAQLADLADIAEHLEFCAVTGNQARGLEIVQRHLGWLDRAPSPHAAMGFAAAAALVLRRVAETGHGTATVRRPAAKERPAADVPVQELRAELAGLAEELAARFDARNGTSYQGDAVRATLAAEPLVAHLALSAYDRRPAPAPAPEPVAEAPAPDFAEVNDLDEALDIGEARKSGWDLARAQAAWRRFDELAADTAPDPLQRARRLDAYGVELSVAGDQQGGLEAWQEALGLFEELGDAERQHRTLSRIGMVHFGEGDPERGLAELTAAAAYFDEHPPKDGSVLGVRMRLANAYLHSGRAAEVPAVLDGVVPDGPVEVGGIEFLRARALLDTGDVEGGLAAARRALAARRQAGEGAERAEAALLLGWVLAQQVHQGGEGAALVTEALTALDEAVAWTPTGTLPRAGAHAERGMLLLAVDRAADAVPDLVEAVAGFTVEGAREQATHARVDLAAAYHGTGRHLEAAETAEEALSGLAGTGDLGSERRCRLILAHAQKDLGEEEAAEVFAGLGEEAAAAGDHPAAAHFLGEAAEVLTALDKDAQAAERFEAAADASVAAGDPHAAVQFRRRAAMCFLWGHKTDEAVAAIERSRAALADLPADNPPARTWETALVSYDQARILAETGRLGEALAHASAAVDGFTSLGETGPAETAARLRDDIGGSLGQQP